MRVCVVQKYQYAIKVKTIKMKISKELFVYTVHSYYICSTLFPYGFYNMI